MSYHCRGSVIAKIIGNNVRGKPDAFVERVLMYVYEEVVDGMKLTEIINTRHENIKYLPGCMLPDNIVSIWFLSCVHRFNSERLKTSIAVYGNNVGTGLPIGQRPALHSLSKI